MSSVNMDSGTWLRPTGIPKQRGSEEQGRSEEQGGELFERGGFLVQAGRRLGQVVRRRPSGITPNQWNSAVRAQLAFVVWDTHTWMPVFAAELRDPDQQQVPEKVDRMTTAVCDAVGLGLLRIESSALRLGPHARRVVEYVVDAFAYTRAASPGEEGSPAPLGFRDITGRLPDGRTGYVNDLGVVARAAAVEAYATGQVADPIIRGLHVRWQDGPAEGWGWLEVAGGRCLFERTRVWQRGFSCGVEPGRLAEDLAAAAIGERLKTLDAAEPQLRGKEVLGRDFAELRLRRDEMQGGFEYDHLSF